MKRILIIEPNWLGDVLFTTPSIRAIRERNKDAFIAVVVHPRCVPILEDNPHINELIVLKKMRGVSGFLEKLRLVPLLKSKNFDIVFLFHRSMTHALVCLFAGIPERIGYHTQKRFFLLTKRILPDWHITHRVEYFLDLLRSKNIDTNNKNYEFCITDEDKKSSLQILKENHIAETEAYLVINPGGNWFPKRWPKENFAKLADELFKKYNTKIIITGAKKDIQLGKDIINLCASRPISLCGLTSLKQLAVILKQAKLVVANDSGPMHISLSQKTPTIALFGPTHPEITGPYGDTRYVIINKNQDCSVPCYDKNCNWFKCMEAISVNDVMEAAEKLLK